MAEGRRDRSGRRRHKSERQQQTTTGVGLSSYDSRTTGYNRASSDSEVTQAVGSSWAREKCHFHEGVDVDQLARYRRRRIEAPRAKDRLEVGTKEETQPAQQQEQQQRQKKEGEEEEDDEEGLKNFVTEYRLAFRTASIDDISHASQKTTLRSKSQEDGDLPDLRASHDVPLTIEKIDEPEKSADEGKEVMAQKSQTRLDFEKVTEMGSDVFKKQAPIRQPTALRYGGDFSPSTEYKSLFVTYPGARRPQLRRRGTSLRMEGDFEASTEKNEAFKEWPIDQLLKPQVKRLQANLKLEGDLESKTECREQYLPFVGARRPELLKRSSEWRTEGDVDCWLPEYADVFRAFDFIDRPAAKLPVPNLRPDGGFYDQTEMKDYFIDPRDKEIEMAKEEDEMKDQGEDRSRAKKEAEMRLLGSKLEDLRGAPPLEIPEYKAAYKEFPRERAKLAKPDDEIGLSDGSKVPSSSPNHFSKKIDQDLEYRSIFIEHRPKDHPPLSRRALASRRPSASSSSNNGQFGFHYRRSRFADPQPLTEIRSQYVNYGQVPRTESLRAPANLRLEGSIDLEPEYRTAFRDYRTNSIQVEPAPRPRDRSLSASRRGNDNYWIDNDNRDHFGAVNAAEDQDAFQVLHTRLHEESVVGKPPPASRRNSRSSLARGTLDADRPRLRNRSPGPVYSRSQQQQLPSSQLEEDDDLPPRNFPRHRSRRPSPSHLVHASNNRSPSPIQQTTERPYSPSFAKEPVSARPQQAFVVLDNLTKDLDNGLSRRRKTERRYDPHDSLAVGSTRASNGNLLNVNINNNRLPPQAPKPSRNRSPSNWMPPWYDSSTSTI